MANPYYDIWRRRELEFTSLKQAREALADEDLLGSFFGRLSEVLTLIEAARSTSGFDTTLARDMLQQKRVNVLVYGESGSGKSSLVKAILNEESVVTSATTQGTLKEEGYMAPCGVRVIDTPGFKVPLTRLPSVGSTETPSILSYSWIQEVFAWNRLLGDVKRRVLSQTAAERPLALVYVHRAGSRLLPERLIELIRIPHEHLVPVFFVISDVCSVDDSALKSVKALVSETIANLGPNKKGREVALLEVNSSNKSVRGHMYRQFGIKEIISSLLSSLDPVDALTFCQSTWVPRLFGGKRQQLEPRPADDAAPDSGDDSEGDDGAPARRQVAVGRKRARGN
jgi:hypothetical protein